MWETMRRWMSARSPVGASPGRTYVGTLTDGRVLVDLRGVPGGRLGSAVADVRQELGGLERTDGARRVFLVDGPILEAWQQAGPEVTLAITRALTDMTAGDTLGDELWIAHPAGDPAPTANPAIVFLLRSLGLEVRPFAIL